MTEEREKRQPTGEYTVGYCRPPVASRWKPGESGRPPGVRGKKVMNKLDADIYRLLRQELLKEIEIREDGKPVRVRLLNLLAKQLINDVLKGTPAQRLKLFKMMNEMGLLVPSAESHEEQKEALGKLVNWLISRPSEI